MGHRLVAPFAIVMLLLAGCGSDDEGATSDPTAGTTAAASGDVMFNDADVTFAQNMVPHHEQAIAMADLALSPGSGARAEVVALAERVKAAQGPEVEMMEGWLETWGHPMADDMGHDEDDMAAMGGMDRFMTL